MIVASRVVQVVRASERTGSVYPLVRVLATASEGELSMDFNPAKFLLKRIRFSSAILLPVLALYIATALYAFSQWVEPSLDGRTNDHIAADSTIYIGFADSLREGKNDPYVTGALSTFPTLWFPVLLALLLKYPLAIAMFDCAVFLAGIFLLSDVFPLSVRSFVLLLLINATTTISLLSVNKEIIDFFAISLFLFSYKRRKRGLILFSLCLALSNRFEVCIVMLLFLVAESRFNPLRKRRGLTVAAIVLAVSVLLPVAASAALAYHFEEASEAGLVATLDRLEMHYLYFVAVVPKIMENLFGELINFSKWSSYSFSDPANSYFLLSNNLATALVIFILATKRMLTLKLQIVYFATIGYVMMATALVIQPRYFYFAYVLLCLQAAHQENRTASSGRIIQPLPGA